MAVVGDNLQSLADNGGGTESPRRRKSSGRSKSGCLTCRQKRVKCDETKPACRRCNRLSLNCVWSSDEPGLKERRRGFGPLKSRMSQGWTPTTILPASSHTQVSRQGQRDGTSRHVSGTNSESSLTAVAGVNLTEDLLAADPSNAGSIGESPQDATLWISELFNTTASPTAQQVEVDSSEAGNEQVSSWEPLTSPEFMGLDDLLAPKNIPTLDFTYSIPNDIILSVLDRQAIDYYASDFSHVQITKRFPWSTNALLLRLGYERSIVMRFLLAASLNEIHRRGTNHGIELKQLAEIHFQIGCTQFSELMVREDEVSSDPRPILASVFFCFLYLSRRKFVDRLRIRALSRIASEYMRKHRLHALGAPFDDSMAPGFSPVPTTDSSSDRRLIVQLLRWIFFKDVQMDFHGCGGSVATHILGAVKHHDGLSRASSSLANNIWGNSFQYELVINASSYPESEVIDDLQNASTTDCLYQVFTVMQDVNQYSSKTEPDLAHARDIQGKLQKVEMKYQALFLLSPSKTSPRSPMLINVDLTISRFHATRIYLFRAEQVGHAQCPPGEALPPAVQKSISAILAIAHGVFASSLPSPYERLQWPLFMTGIETRDVIHREWILSHMRPSALKTSLSRVIKAQVYLGYRLGIAVIKEIIKDVDRNIAENNALGAFAGEDVDSWVDVEDENDFCLW